MVMAQAAGAPIAGRPHCELYNLSVGFMGVGLTLAAVAV